MQCQKAAARAFLCILLSGLILVQHGRSDCLRCHATAAGPPHHPAATVNKERLGRYLAFAKATNNAPRLEAGPKIGCTTCHADHTKEEPQFEGGLAYPAKTLEEGCRACHFFS
jgi:hypothetical protein